MEDIISIFLNSYKNAIFYNIVQYIYIINKIIFFHKKLCSHHFLFSIYLCHTWPLPNKL